VYLIQKILGTTSYYPIDNSNGNKNNSKSNPGSSSGYYDEGEVYNSDYRRNNKSNNNDNKNGNGYKVDIDDCDSMHASRKGILWIPTGPSLDEAMVMLGTVVTAGGTGGYEGNSGWASSFLGIESVGSTAAAEALEPLLIGYFIIGLFCYIYSFYYL
jgi:hypothetical protein